jgi:DNA-directed RNA polymerase specialized sigma24 family protein
MNAAAQVRALVSARRPERAAVTELFHLHHRRLVGLAALLVIDRETAEDVV